MLRFLRATLLSLSSYCSASLGFAYDAVDVALEKTTSSYEWGKAGNGVFDCSGLTQFAFAHLGISLPRLAAEQALVGVPVASSLDEIGNLQRGDLVFFANSKAKAALKEIEHVGIYIGDGKMINAVWVGDEGTPGEIKTVRVDDFTTNVEPTWWRSIFVSASRLPVAPGPSTRFSVGDIVEATESGVNIRADESDWPKVLQSLRVGKTVGGARGQILSRPLFFEGNWFWKVDFETGDDGWVAEQFLGKLDSANPPYVHIGTFGSAGSSDGQFNFPAAVAVNASTSQIYVADRGNPTASNRLQIFDRTGATHLRTISGLVNPGGVVVQSSTGNTYVADNFANSVSVYSPTGSLISVFGLPGSTGGGLSGPTGIAISNDGGTVYVVDHREHRIQVFTSGGAFVRSFGRQGTGDGEFWFPSDIAIDPVDGNLIVSEQSNNRIQVVTPSGSFVRTFGAAGSGDGQFADPHGVAVDPITRNILVADYGNHRIQIFSREGAYLGKFGGLGSSDGQFNFPQGLAIASNRELIVADSRNNRVQRFSPRVGQLTSYVYARQFVSSGAGSGGPLQTGGICIDARVREVSIVDGSEGRVEVYSVSGALLRTVGAGSTSSPPPEGTFLSLTHVARDSISGTFVVGDYGFNSVSIFNSDGSFLRRFGGRSGNGPGEFTIGGVAVQAQTRRILVADQLNSRVQVFDADGMYLSEMGSLGNGGGQLNGPGGVATYPSDGRVVVSDSGNHRIVVFDALGNFIRTFGQPGSAPAQFNVPSGVAVDPQTGNIVVADLNNFRIQIFSATGEFLASAAVPIGTGDAFRYRPVGVAVDPETREIFVTTNLGLSVLVFTLQ